MQEGMFLQLKISEEIFVTTSFANSAPAGTASCTTRVFLSQTGKVHGSIVKMYRLI